MLPMIYARHLYRAVLHWWLHISIWMGILWFLALLPGPAEFQAIFIRDCKVCSGGQGNWGWESIACNCILVYLMTHWDDQTVCPQFIDTQAHTLGWIFPTSFVCRYEYPNGIPEDILAINRSLSGSYKVHWVLGSCKASSLIKSGKTNAVSNFRHTEITSVSVWKSALNNLMKKVD